LAKRARDASPVVVTKKKKRRPGAAFAFSGPRRLSRLHRERAVASVVVENVFAKISNEKIVEAIVVVIADADAFGPQRNGEDQICSDVGKVPSRLV